MIKKLHFRISWFFLLAVIITKNGTANFMGEGDPVSTVDSLEQLYLNWYNLDPESTTVQGAQVDKAYKELLEGKLPQKKIVVAVIDGGVDIYHEDLQGKIWVNKDEIPDNGIDDDENGYIDDMHGWNFIGNEKGENINHDTYEFVRIIRKYDSAFKSLSPEQIQEERKEEFDIYRKCINEYTKEVVKYEQEKKELDAFETKFKHADSVMSQYLKRDIYTPDDLLKINTDVEIVKQARSFLMTIYSRGFTKDLLKKLKEHNDLKLNKHLNLALNPREVVGDNWEDFNDRAYGNNAVKGPRAHHGTFVAGVIAANRNNSLGIDGIVENVEIMVLRVVPDGDEYDKDVALSIMYAVDNGANIINMSFGKDYSPQKYMVDEAMRYAEANNVLLVHAAGNESDNVDLKIHYPTKFVSETDVVENWITVGANTLNANKQLAGIFSNYGRKTVDLFAPGVDIISLSPESKYHIGSGTSFSCPVVSGVAALVWSYYPDISAIELKNILLESTTKYGRLRVYIPNTKTKKKKKTRFYKLSKTGGVVNAYNALLLAEERSKL